MCHMAPEQKHQDVSLNTSVCMYKRSKYEE